MKETSPNLLHTGMLDDRGSSAAKKLFAQFGGPRKALITGITGQDGSYLAKLLLEKGYEVFGLVRRTSSLEPYARIQKLVDQRSVTLLDGNLRDPDTLRVALERSQPDEIYNLAAQSDVAKSFSCPDETRDINFYGLDRLTYLAKQQNPSVRIYQASTSEMFGSTPPPQNEQSPFNPQSPYAESKLDAHEKVVIPYREKGLFICSGLLFNHESPLRGINFVTQKVVTGLTKIKLKLQDVPLELGNIYSKRDWGFAGDYVQAMWLMLQQNNPDDFVIATGKAYTIKHLVGLVADDLNLGLVWEGVGLEEKAYDEKTGQLLITINKDFHRPKDVDNLLGNNSKARRVLGWEPKVTIGILTRMMTNAAIEKYQKLR